MLKQGKAMLELKFLVLGAGHVFVPQLSILGLHNNNINVMFAHHQHIVWIPTNLENLHSPPARIH
jgi:hypothetical protein